tara:strand:- start:2658 stop:3314 length:657 start_codon:yes stop_codon:yes gene_type:complete
MNKICFLETEGDDFFQRNKDAHSNEKYVGEDIILKKLSNRNLENLNILEIGCCQGWRLHELQNLYPSCNYFGLEPSQQGVDEGNSKPNNTVSFQVGTCDNMYLFDNNQFDIILVPFVFMYVDRDLLLKSVSEIDRVLKNNGKLIISDFYSNRQRKNSYKYIPNSFIHKQNWFEIFVSTQNYFLEDLQLFCHNTTNEGDVYDDTCCYTELKKDTLNLFN